MDEGVFTRVGRNLAEAVVPQLEDMTRIITPGRLLNISICPANCTFPQGKCVNGSCVCEFLFTGKSCESFTTEYLTTFATLSSVLFVIASIQLVLCMIYDSHDNSQSDDRWKNAFRITIRKCLLGTVIAATGTRAIYFTVEQFSCPHQWADVLHNIYYPALITAFSILICFWAEVFYNSDLVNNQDFMRRHRYFIGCTVFNILVYLLLLGDVIATPLVNEVEQNRKDIVIGVIFVVLLLLMLIGFLHYGVRLFFRPDWRPLSDVFRINPKQQTYSCVGVISSALMQCLIIALLLLNLASRFNVVNSHSVYTGNMVIHVIELGLPIWFCCTLWNFKRPGSLWILNPSLLLQPNKAYDSEVSDREPLLTSSSGGQYGAITDSLTSSGKLFPDCWICLDQGNTSDFFKPCKCPEVHRACLTKWIQERATFKSRSESFQCQVCKAKYRVIKKRRSCIPQELKLRHWFMGLGLVILFFGVSSVSWFIKDISPPMGKAAVAFTIFVIDAVILKIIGFCLLWTYKRQRIADITIIGDSVRFSTLLNKRELSPTPQDNAELNHAHTNTIQAELSPTNM